MKYFEKHIDLRITLKHALASQHLKNDDSRRPQVNSWRVLKVV